MIISKDGLYINIHILEERVTFLGVMAIGKTEAFYPSVAAVTVLLLLAMASVDQATCQSTEFEQCFVACDQGYYSCRRGCVSKEDEAECHDACADSAVECFEGCPSEPPPADMLENY